MQQALSQPGQQWLHTFDFVQWFKALPELQSAHLMDDDLLNMFVEFVAIDIGSKHTLDIHKLCAKVTDFAKASQALVDYSRVIGSHAELNMQQLREFKLRLAEQLEDMQRSPYDYLGGSYCS